MPVDEVHWICVCRYHNSGPICTHCGRLRSDMKKVDSAACTCPDWWNFIMTTGPHYKKCEAYEDCGGWTLDPPCGGCDRCITDQAFYYDPDLSAQLWQAEQEAKKS